MQFRLTELSRIMGNEYSNESFDLNKEKSLTKSGAYERYLKILEEKGSSREEQPLTMSGAFERYLKLKETDC